MDSGFWLAMADRPVETIGGGGSFVVDRAGWSTGGCGVLMLKLRFGCVAAGEARFWIFFSCVGFPITIC